MKKLLLIFFTFINIFSIGYGRYGFKIAEEIPWTLEYTFNKYGEKDKIKGAVYGQWARMKEIYIDERGITITLWGDAYQMAGLYGKVIKVSFLFDSKKEIIIEDIFDLEAKNSFEKIILVDKNNKNYKEIIKNIKNSKKMSILIEDDRGENYSFSNISNKGSSLVITRLEKSLK